MSLAERTALFRDDVPHPDVAFALAAGKE